MLRFLPRDGFQEKVKAEEADRYTKHFTAWNQLVVNLYAQATGKKSLRDIEIGLKMHQPTWAHLGLVNAVRSTIAHANARREWRLYAGMFYLLLGRCRDLTPQRKFRFKAPLRALDATLIEVCLSVFPWAKFRRKKGALKLHTLLDIRGTIPEFLVVTDGKHHDGRVARETSWPISSDSILVMDKAYLDFEWLYGLNEQRIWFVLRAKDNQDYRVIGQHEGARGKGVLGDEIIEMVGLLTRKKYPAPLRLVTYYDEEENRVYQFLTNNWSLAASTIARIYQARWEIECFFKWIKQNLKIKTFLGTSINAVMTQIWTAMIYYLLLAYIKYQTSFRQSLLCLTRILRETLFFRVDIIDVLKSSLVRVKKLRDACAVPVLF
jgi:hypothetical protein